MGPHDLARRLADAGATLSAAAAVLPVSGPGPAVFGVDATGALGDLTGDLHRGWLAAVEARTAEASFHAARLSEVADAVTRAGTAYTDADDAAVRAATAPTAGGGAWEWRRD